MSDNCAQGRHERHGQAKLSMLKGWNTEVEVGRKERLRGRPAELYLYEYVRYQ